MSIYNTIESSILSIEGGEPIFNGKGGRFEWPIIDESVEMAVLTQLRENISIYNRSGVFARIEETYAKMHDARHALVVNSGTSALFSCYEGLNLGPEDEVICPSYTFFATISPIVYTGARVVFCDSRSDGNIDPLQLEALINEKTRAIVVTHMWGMPCDMTNIMAIANSHGIAVIEDCSHAHGATTNGKIVGSLGTAAAWSLQGQKIVTGGEGGILVTNNDDLFYRALAHGHYNKRCKAEIPQDHLLHDFSITGLGLKLRAHPLAIALAENQLSRLDGWLKKKREFAALVTAGLEDIQFLTLPIANNCEPSWYAYVMNYDEQKANGIPLDIYINALHAEGLIEIDIPTSTGPIHNMPLFTRTHEVLPRLYSQAARKNIGQHFPNAEHFYRTAFKMPVWVREADRHVVEKYVAGIRKVSSAIHERPEIFLK